MEKFSLLYYAVRKFKKRYKFHTFESLSLVIICFAFHSSGLAATGVLFHSDSNSSGAIRPTYNVNLSNTTPADNQVTNT